MIHENFNFLKIKFKKTPPSLLDSILWFETIMKDVPLEQHPFVWPEIHEHFPELLIGGMFFPYDMSTYDTYEHFVNEKINIFEKIEAFNTSGRYKDYNKAFALRLLQKNKYLTFKNHYQKENTQIWDVIAPSIPPEVLSAFLIENIQDTFMVVGGITALLSREVLDPQEIMSIDDRRWLINLIEEHHPNIKEYPSWTELRDFYSYQVIHREISEENNQTLAHHLHDIMKKVTAEFDAMTKTAYIPPMTEEKSLPKQEYDEFSYMAFM